MKQIIKSAMAFPESAENKVYSTTFFYVLNGVKGVTTLNIEAPSSQDIQMKVFKFKFPGCHIYRVSYDEI